MLRIATAVLACWCVSGLAAPSAPAADVYSYANGCYALIDVPSNRYVVRDGSSYTATATTRGAATPFRMQATRLGDYLLYGPFGAMPATTAPPNGVGPTSTPGRPADWSLSDQAGKLRIVSVSTGRALGLGIALGLDDGLRQVSRGAGERHRATPEGREPHRQGAGLP
jgi:hypothetical protein